jgi:hypothetical protein
MLNTLESLDEQLRMRCVVFLWATRLLLLGATLAGRGYAFTA